MDPSKFLIIFLTTISISISLASGQTTPKVLVCYYEATSWRRDGVGKFDIREMDPHLCTHIIYSFIGMKPGTNKIYSRDPGLDLGTGETEPDPDDPANDQGDLDMIRKTVQLRNGGNPDLKILLSVGGSNQTSRSFSNMARHIANRTAFIRSVVEYVERFEVDGVDLFWKYDDGPENGGRPEDKETNVVLFREMRTALTNLTTFTGREYILSAAFGCTKKVIDAAYNVTQLAMHLDHFHLLCFDFKMYTETSQLIGHHSPLHPKTSEDPEDKELTVAFGVNLFLELGTPAQKLILGVSAHARTYELGRADLNNFYDQCMGPGPAGKFTGERGFLAYFEICDMIRENHEQWLFRYDYDYSVPYTCDETNWFGYDNEISTKEKVDFAIEKGLGGMMLKFIDLDDCKNLCGGWHACPIAAATKNRLAFWAQKV